MFFQSLKAKDYRGLYSFEAREFRRINIISGLNGAGKSTVLEALFAILDYKDPTTIMKPFVWKGLPVDLSSAASFFFSDGDLKKKTSLEARTQAGRITMDFRYEDQPAAPPMSIDITQPAPISKNASQQGITIRVSLNGHPADETHLIDIGGGGTQAWKQEQKQIKLPLCHILSRKTIDNAPSLTAKFSNAVRRKDKGRVLEFARNIIPEISDLTLLQVHGSLQLCGSIEPETYVPVAFLGDGALSMISIGMSIMEAQGGAVFLDEFESTIHYSKLQTVWREIAKASEEFDCQIFAVTHSKEAIEFAVAGLTEAGHSSMLKYMRIDKIGHQNKVTEYSFDEVDSAIDEGWEIR